MPASVPTAAADNSIEERILRGATEVFGRMGYANTRVEDILAAAKLSRPTFYKVFKSKDDVFQALSKRHHAEIRSRMAEVSDPSDSPTRQFLRGAEVFLRWRVALGSLGRVLDAEARSPGSRQMQQREHLIAEVARSYSAGIVATGRQPADPLVVRALIAAAESLGDSLDSLTRVRETDIQRRLATLSRIVAGTLGDDAEPVPPRPRRARR